MSIAIVVISEMFEFLLACCVPDLELKFLVLVDNVLYFEVYANSAQMRRVDIPIHIL